MHINIQSNAYLFNTGIIHVYFNLNKNDILCGNCRGCTRKWLKVQFQNECKFNVYLTDNCINIHLFRSIFGHTIIGHLSISSLSIVKSNLSAAACTFMHECLHLDWGDIMRLKLAHILFLI